MTNRKWNAQSYSENSRLQYKASKEFFDSIPLKGNETILDIGCGTGILTNEIAKKLPQGKIIGIDSSENMIAFANKHFSQPNLEFILMNANTFNFTFKFDVIISSFCIQWIKDKQALFHRIAAHLNNNGSTNLIMVFRHEGIAKIRNQLMIGPKWSQYFDPVNAQEVLVFDNLYDHYAKEAGLNNLVYQTEHVTTSFATTAEMKNFLKNIVAYLDQLPTEKLQDEFIQDIINLYIGISPITTNQNCSITYTYGKITSCGLKI